MNKINNIYVGNGSLTPSTGSGPFDINTKLKNAKTLDSLLKGKKFSAAPYVDGTINETIINGKKIIYVRGVIKGHISGSYYFIDSYASITDARKNSSMEFEFEGESPCIVVFSDKNKSHIDLIINCIGNYYFSQIQLYTVYGSENTIDKVTDENTSNLQIWYGDAPD